MKDASRLFGQKHVRTSLFISTLRWYLFWLVRTETTVLDKCCPFIWPRLVTNHLEISIMYYGFPFTYILLLTTLRVALSLVHIFILYIILTFYDQKGREDSNILQMEWKRDRTLVKYSNTLFVFMVWSVVKLDVFRLTPPGCMWAQRPKHILLTVCLTDVKDPQIKVEPDKLYFKGVGGTDMKEHEVTMEFFKKIDVEVNYRFLAEK